MGSVFVETARRVAEERQGSHSKEASALRRNKPCRRRSSCRKVPTKAAKFEIFVGTPLLLQRRHIDDEPVPHIAFQHALICFVDLLNGNDFNIADNVVFGTEIE